MKSPLRLGPARDEWSKTDREVRFAFAARGNAAVTSEQLSTRCDLHALQSLRARCNGSGPRVAAHFIQNKYCEMYVLTVGSISDCVLHPHGVNWSCRSLNTHSSMRWDNAAEGNVQTRQSIRFFFLYVLHSPKNSQSCIQVIYSFIYNGLFCRAPLAANDRAGDHCSQQCVPKEGK